jgi:hypothetical protein
MEKTMRTYTKLVLIFSLLFCGKAFAQTDLAGTWQGKLSLNATDKMTIQFILTKEADGSYKAVLNSPDEGGPKKEPAKNVQFKADKLTLDVPTLNGSYSGTMAKGVITGEWHQQGSTLPLVLTRYQAPTAGALKPLLGSWVGKVKADATDLNVVLRFETAKDGKIVGFLDVPDQNAKDLPVTDILLEGGQVTFKIPVAKADYTGKLVGASITGSFKQGGPGGQENKLNFVRGKYVPPPPVVNIPPEARKQLLGRWSGKLDKGTFVLRFEQKAEKYVVLIDIEPPAGQQGGAKDMLIPSTVLADGKLTLKIAGGAAEYSGTLSGDKIDGTFVQGPNKIPLVLTKEAAPAKAKESTPAPKK